MKNIKKKKLMMQSFVQYTPTKVVFGKDTQKKLESWSVNLGNEGISCIWRWKCNRYSKRNCDRCCKSGHRYLGVLEEDYDAMSEIMWCGSISHNGITGLGRPKDFLCHKLGHQLGAKFDEAHGATLSAVWGSWARYVYHLDEARFANYGRKVWNMDEENDEKTAVEAIEKTEEFFRSLHMPDLSGRYENGCTAG